MFARSLEHVLRSLTTKGDFSHESHDAYQERFKALRSFRLLPPGRQNRARRLTEDQIATAVLGVTSLQPGLAGMTAKVLSNLVPAGSIPASFFGAAKLLDAIVLLITNADARKAVKRVTLSTAEGGVNSHGYAEILYHHPERGLAMACFVSRYATSRTGLGGEKHNEDGYRYSPISRETVFAPQFFNELAREIEQSAYQTEPIGNGDEYLDEETEAARHERLGVKPGGRYLHVGVDNHVAWPKDERLVAFDEYELVLMPKTPESATSIHIDLTRNRLTHSEALTVINRFLSLMSWVDDHYAIAHEGSSGSPVPVPVSKRELAFVTAHGWMFNRSIPVAEEARRALALYREGRNAHQNFLVSYAVLNYYKIVEIGYPGKNSARTWIGNCYPTVKAKYKFDSTFKHFEAACGSQSPKDYLYSACRVAVAHASRKSRSDPDDADEIQRLHVAADVLRWMARHFILEELGVEDTFWEKKQLAAES